MGEEEPRTIVSGLVQYVPKDALLVRNLFRIAQAALRCQAHVDRYQKHACKLQKASAWIMWLASSQSDGKRNEIFRRLWALPPGC